MLVFAAFLLTFANCKDDADTASGIRDYHLPFNCDLDMVENEIVIINDDAVFDKLFAAYEALEIPNFDQQSLLVIKGLSNSGVAKVEKQILADEGKYVLDVKVQRNYAAVMRNWYVAYVLPKTDAEHITLKVAYYE